LSRQPIAIAFYICARNSIHVMGSLDHLDLVRRVGEMEGEGQGEKT
jgi:hypothetical protein